MHLNEHDPRLQDYLDDRLPPAQARELQDHLASCPDCQALVQHALQVETELSRQLARVALSPGFTSRLLDRIAGTTPPAKATEDQKQQLENELRATWNSETRNFFRSQLPAALDWLGYSTAAAVGFYLFAHLALGVSKAQLKPAFLTPAAATLLIAGAAGALFVLAGLGVASRRQLARWFSDLAA